MTRSPWAQEYARTPDEYIWGLAPSAFGREMRTLLAPGARVLELGCGEGRDSVYFATCGCEVTGVDVAAAGLDKAKRLARAHGVTVHWVRGDAARDIPAGPFDRLLRRGRAGPDVLGLAHRALRAGRRQVRARRRPAPPQRGGAHRAKGGLI